MGSWSGLNNQPSFNADTMLLLTDGTVMCHETSSQNWHKLTPDSNGSYANGTWSDLAPLPDNSGIPASAGGPTQAPLYFASAVLRDGTVITGGGEYNSGNAGADILTMQIYDPLADAWTAVATPPGWTGIGDAASCVLADGTFILGNFSSANAALFDPATQIWQATGAKGDSCSEETFTLLPNGNVLTVQCSNAPNAEQYVPGSNTWIDAGSTPSTLPQACPGFVAEIGPALLLTDGTVLAVGATGNTAIYTPDADPTQAGTWASGPTLMDSSNNTQFPMDAPGVLLPNGKVLLVGSPAPPCDYPSPETFFEYDPSTNTAPVIDGPSNNGGPAYDSRLLLLPNGQVLHSNGTDDIEVYTPDSGGDASWKPVITNAPSAMIVGHHYQIFGRQFNGLSQACSYGDDAQCATNYPIVRLSNSSGDVVYLRTREHSTMGVATGKTVVSTIVEVPDDVTPGQWDLVVVANGIASDPQAVTIGTRDCFFLVDRSSYGEGEVQAKINLSGSPATFDDALWVVVEGFSKDQLGGAAPSIPDPVGGMTYVSSGAPIPQDPGRPSSAVQRWTYPFKAVFTGTGMFTGSTQTLTIGTDMTADGTHVSAGAQVELLNTPNPFILHGDIANNKPWYLSVDLRVFQMTAGQTKFAVHLDGTPTDWISNVIDNLNTDPGPLGAVFDAIPQDDEDAAALTLAPADGDGNATYNFALARVRYQDVQVASKVRVFFRLWPAQQTNATYDTNTTYRSAAAAGDKISLLGVNGDEIITIPFFAEPRVLTSQKMTDQSDTKNVRDINPDPLGAEVDSYFGCWLDINRPDDKLFPPRLVGAPNPSDIPDGPFDGFAQLVSIQELVRSQHQCLLAEVSFDPDPIPSNADPSISDKLAQRNLAFVNVPNPGIEASRIAPQTFEIKPTLSLKMDNRPDELMIQWGATPHGSKASIYLPAANAAEILDWANNIYTAHTLKMVDPQTIETTAGGVTYVPVPFGSGANFAGLISVELPDTVQKGRKYEITVRQVTSAQFGHAVQNQRQSELAVSRKGFAWRRTLGMFQLNIPVGTKKELLRPTERLYAILLYIQKAIPTVSRWYPVFQRYLKLMAGRVEGLGGDPSKIKPSGWGIVPGESGQEDGEEDGGLLRRGEEEFSGKVAGLVYDHFGDFEAFLLEIGCGMRRKFVSRELRVEKLAREAWESRCRLTVIVSKKRPECPERIIVGGRTRCDC